jgi:hypothetical protein
LKERKRLLHAVAEVDATVNAVADDDATAGQQLRRKNRLLKF